tara:strand:- start:45 stop:485 length:441 start_codon:yes stop_codon:yes gene_type:complete
MPTQEQQIQRKAKSILKELFEEGDRQIMDRIYFAYYLPQQATLDYETAWSVQRDLLLLKHKYIDSDSPVILRSSCLDYKNEREQDGSRIVGEVWTVAKNGTIKELWKACENLFIEMRDKYGAWHRIIESIEPIEGKPGEYEVYFAS